jgi:CheY-like chemotaxis protein
MHTILTASNSEILRLLGTRTCSRLGVARHVAPSGPEALEAARREQPRLAILDVTMPDLDGFAVCRAIKAEPALKACRVMLVVDGILTRALLDRLSESGCDDVLVMPVISEEFFSHVANLLNVPRRQSRRVIVELMARLDGGPVTWDGKVENLSLHGAKVRLERPLGETAEVRIRLNPPGADRAAILEARVVWAREGRRLVGLEFRGVSPAALEFLENLVLWEVAVEDGVQRAFLDGDFSENTDFSSLTRRLSGVVDFDAAGVRYINSSGAHRWIAFLRTLTVDSYSFSRCSVAFTTQASLVPSFLGRGRVVSFMAPFHCDGCERDEARLLQTSALVREGGTHSVPRFRCPSCQGQLAFDEVPERFLAFTQWA